MNTTKNTAAKRFIVTGKKHGVRMYAGERVGHLTRDPARAKVWSSRLAAEHAAVALVAKPGGEWTVIPFEVL